METELGKNHFLRIYLFSIHCLLYICNCAHWSDFEYTSANWAVANLGPNMYVLKGYFRDIREICRNEGGALLSPVMLTDEQRNRISGYTLWTGSYVTASDWITYEGCYSVDIPKNYPYRYLLQYNSPEKCQIYCRCHQYFALQKNKCVCLDSNIGTYAHNLSQCNIQCNGSVEQMCGSKLFVSVYKGLKFQQDDSMVGQKCLTMKCLNNSVDSIELRSHNCSVHRQFLCNSDNNQILFPSSVQNLSWFNSSSKCYTQNRILEAYVNNKACVNRYLHSETWLGFFKNIVSMNLEDPYRNPVLSCQVMDIDTSNTHDIKSCEQEQHYFICQANKTQQYPENRSCSLNIYPGHLFADVEENTVHKDTFFTSSVNFPQTSTDGKNAILSKPQNSLSTPSTHAYSEDSTLANTASTPEKKLTNANKVVSILPMQQTQSLLAIFNIVTSTVSYGNQTHRQQVYRTKLCKECVRSRNKPTTDNKTVMIAGMTSGVIILLVVFVVAITLRCRKRLAKGKQGPSLKVNNVYDYGVTSNFPRKNSEKHSYANVNTETCTGDIELKENRIKADYSAHGYINVKFGQTYKSSAEPTDENRYDSFMLQSRNVVTDDIYDYTRGNQELCVYDKLHNAKNVVQCDEVYDHTRDNQELCEYGQLQKNKNAVQCDDVYDHTQGNQEMCEYDELHNAKNVVHCDDDFYNHTRRVLEVDVYDTVQKHKFSSNV